MSKGLSIDEIDQVVALVRDSLPALWWALYAGCVKEGFTESQAMLLLREFIRKPSDPEAEE